MRDQIPPHPADIEDDLEEVIFEDDDEMEMGELAWEELEARLETSEHEERNSPVQVDSIYTFREHSNAVATCAWHPNSDYCTTGAGGYKVWNRKTGDVVYENTEHKANVLEVLFNHDGTYLASGDMNGGVMIHKVQLANGSSDKDGILTLRKVLEFSISPIYWMLWHKAANVLFAGSEDGEITVFHVPCGHCEFLPGNGGCCTAGDLTNDGLKLLAAYENGAVKLWDIKSRTVVMEINEHNPRVVCCDKENPIYAVGDTTGKIVFCTPSGPVGHVYADSLILCLSFSPSADFRMVATSTLRGQVAIWDYSQLSLRILCEEPGGRVFKIQWISEFTFLVAIWHGNVIAYDARTGQRKLIFHPGSANDFSYDPRESLLLTASADKSAKIFKIPELGD